MVAPCFPMAGRGRAQLIGLAKAANDNRPGNICINFKKKPVNYLKISSYHLIMNISLYIL